MLNVKKILGVCAALSAATISFGAEGEGVAPAAAKLIDFGNGWAISNSMITGWAISGFILFLVFFFVGKPKILPGKGQAVFESLLETLRDLLEPIIGKKAFPAAFPLLVTFFVFILIHNWMGLIPGVGTMGWGHGEHWWNLEHMDTALIRPFNSDFNGTIALAVISFGAWLIIVIRFAGLKLLVKDLFGNKAEKSETPGWLYPILTLVFMVVGLIEVMSIVIRPVTLSVRLFGNVFGGENLLHGTGFVFVFYFMELLVGLIQALVFTLLTSVYIGLICNHGDEHDHAGDHATEGQH